MRVVHKIMLDSESIMGVLQKTGLSLKQIAVAAPRLQKTFRTYLDAVDIKADQNETDEYLEKKNQISIENILRETGATLIDANRAATLIQAAFRGHYQRMLEREQKGEIQWQRAVVNTMQILRKAGINQSEASKTATLIQSAYRGYYTRRNIKIKIEEEKERKQMDYLEPRETIQAVAWLDMMFDDSGLTKEQANEAASIIQRAFRNYRGKRNSKEVPKITSSRSLVVEAIVDNLHQKVFKNILDRDDFPKELGSREMLSESIDKVHSAYKELLRKSQYSEGEDELFDLEKDELVQNKVDLKESKEETEMVDVKMIEEKIEEIKDQEEVEGSKQVQENQDQEDEGKHEDQENEKDQENQEDQ
ncbi:uncharacterized protein LOC117172159 isoform X2 [Belonocnema kinseyi]|nr:uncharacterized protein LOC117172159 isoform X2 [Belonocnema kinseyi]